MAKGSVRKKGKKWYGRFYIEDESGRKVQKEFAGTESKAETEAMLRKAIADYEEKQFADTRTFCGFLYGKSHFDCVHSINLLFRILILQLLFYHYTYSVISCQPISQPFIVYLQFLSR